MQGRKRLAATPWGDLVLARRQSILGPDRAAVRWAFADHGLIESLGLGSDINVCVEHGGELLAASVLVWLAWAWTRGRPYRNASEHS